MSTNPDRLRDMALILLNGKDRDIQLLEDKVSHLKRALQKANIINKQLHEELQEATSHNGISIKALKEELSRALELNDNLCEQLEKERQSKPKSIADFYKTFRKDTKRLSICN